MAKYLVMVEDYPTKEWDGVLQLIRYSKREEYLTIEHRWVNNLNEKDISRKNAKTDFDEIAVNNEDIIKLRDFLNSLNLNGEVKKDVPEVRKCVGCETEVESVFMYKGTFYDENKSEWVKEIYCNECLANILTEDPSILNDVYQI